MRIFRFKHEVISIMNPGPYRACQCQWLGADHRCCGSEATKRYSKLISLSPHVTTTTNTAKESMIFGFTSQPSSDLPRSCRHYFTTVFGTWPSAKLVCFIPLKDPGIQGRNTTWPGHLPNRTIITSWLPSWFFRRGIYMKSQNSPEPKAGMMIMGEMLRWRTLFFWRMLLLTCVLPVGSQSLLADDMLMLSLLESPWFIIFHCQTLALWENTRDQWRQVVKSPTSSMILGWVNSGGLVNSESCKWVMSHSAVKGAFGRKNWHIEFIGKFRSGTRGSCFDVCSLTV